MFRCWHDCFVAFRKHSTDAARESTALGSQAAISESLQVGSEVTPLLTLSFKQNIQFDVFPTRNFTSAPSASTSFGRDSTGSRPWWGGLLLASWIVNESPDFFEGLDIYELGCGSFALPSIVACIQGARVVATDGCQNHVHQVCSTLKSNGPRLRACSSRHFAWEDGVASSDQKVWDIVLFADVLYHCGAAALLAQTVASLIRPGGMVFGTVGLHRTASSEIFAEMLDHNFVAEEIPISDSVLSAALDASICLNKASMFDSVCSSVESTDFPRNECMLVRWVERIDAVLAGSDISETLRQRVLNAPYAANDHSQKSTTWVPTE